MSERPTLIEVARAQPPRIRAACMRGLMAARLISFVIEHATHRDLEKPGWPNLDTDGVIQLRSEGFTRDELEEHGPDAIDIVADLDLLEALSDQHASEAAHV